jgi:hypothetical protein
MEVAPHSHCTLKDNTRSVCRIVLVQVGFWETTAPSLRSRPSLESVLARDSPPDDWRDDMRQGLSVITSRSESLSRFIGAYARLAKLPRPQPQPLGVAECVGRAASFETRVPVTWRRARRPPSRATRTRSNKR